MTFDLDRTDAQLAVDISPDSPLDPGIARYVAILKNAGIHTNESCEGGPGHSYRDPTVCFLGGVGEGYQALAVCLSWGLPVRDLMRCWQVVDHHIEAVFWLLTFRPKAEQVIPSIAWTFDADKKVDR